MLVFDVTSRISFQILGKWRDVVLNRTVMRRVVFSDNRQDTTEITERELQSASKNEGTEAP